MSAKVIKTSLFGAVSLKEVYPVTSFNTGTLVDLFNGDVIKGYDGKFYIRGGIGNFITGFYGRGNSYKSTICDALIGRMSAIYSAEVGVVDTEGVKTEQRLITCAGDLSSMIIPEHIHLISGAANSLGDIYTQIEALCKAKEENKKDFTIETPFIDPDTGKRQLAWVPTVLYMDSFSEAFSAGEEALLNEEGIDGKKVKTLYMLDGNQKTVFIRQIRRLCELYGLVIVCTTHVGGNINIDSYGPVAKKLQHMKQDEALKGVGSKFYYLARNLFQTASASILQDTKKEAEYPFNSTPNEDINEVILKSVRCKSNISGSTIPLVVSQTKGLLNDVTHYHFLKGLERFGLPGNNTTHRCAFNPDIVLSRTTIREKAAESYELRRGLELCAHLAYIQNQWMPIPELMPVWKTTPEELYEKLQKVDSPKVSDILNSVGYWQPDKKGNRPYMSIFDVLTLINK